MNKVVRLTLMVTVAMTLLAAAGCNKPMQLERYFSQIKVGQSNSTDVLNMLPAEGMLSVSNSVSVLNNNTQDREVGIVVFSETDSSVQRMEYLQKRTNLMNVRVGVVIAARVPQEILDQPYESDMRKRVAILRYCHEKLVADIKPFKEDQETESLMGLARTALSVGIYQLGIRPREAYKMLTSDGFEFDHPNMNKCRLNLTEEGDIYTIMIRTKAGVDPLVSW